MASLFEKLGQLTDTDESTKIVSATAYKAFTFQFLTAGAGANIVLRIESSPDGVNWFNVSATDHTYTTNAVHVVDFTSRVLSQVRVRKISGDKTATVWMGANNY